MAEKSSLIDTLFLLAIMKVGLTNCRCREGETISPYFLWKVII